MNISSIQSLMPKTGFTSPSSQPAAAASDSFASMLADLGNQTVASLKASETTSMAALQGQASVQEVVMNTLAAEQSLQAAVAVRDKLVSALNDLSHMQV